MFIPGPGLRPVSPMPSRTCLIILSLPLAFSWRLGVLGLDLNKMTVLLGAFGVGIGFGLQSVVNNFVSGTDSAFRTSDPCGRHGPGR